MGMYAYAAGCNAGDGVPFSSSARGRGWVPNTRSFSLSKSNGLSRITADATAKTLEVTSTNPMTRLEGRTSLLASLNAALQSISLYFGQSARPGNMLDYLEANSPTGPTSE